MAGSARIGISLPEDVLKEIDQQARREKKNRSQYIKEAVGKSLREQRRKRLEAEMAKVYREIEQEEIALAEEFFPIVAETFPQDSGLLPGQRHSMRAPFGTSLHT